MQTFARHLAISSLLVGLQPSLAFAARRVNTDDPRLVAIVESYGQTGEKTGQQIAVRDRMVPERLQAGGTPGLPRNGPPTRAWMSPGLRILF